MSSSFSSYQRPVRCSVPFPHCTVSSTPPGRSKTATHFAAYNGRHAALALFSSRSMSHIVNAVPHRYVFNALAFGERKARKLPALLLVGVLAQQIHCSLPCAACVGGITFGTCEPCASSQSPYWLNHIKFVIFDRACLFL